MWGGGGHIRLDRFNILIAVNSVLESAKTSYDLFYLNDGPSEEEDQSTSIKPYAIS
jgi:hypothetical protein